MSRNLPLYGPKRPDHPSVGEKCAACLLPFAAGDFTTIVALGPGIDEESRQAAREGRVYNAVAQEIHWACATGETWVPA